MNVVHEKSVVNTISIRAFLEKIKSPDAQERIAAINMAPEAGADAVQPLGEIYGGKDFAASKAAHEALTRLVHHAARPGAASEAKAVAGKLLLLASPGQPSEVRREALHLLGFVATEDYADKMAKYLTDADVREEARLALQRVPGRKVDRALMRAAQNTTGDFRTALDIALKARSQPVRHGGLTRR